jgi:beta-lactam-binding protein with PASTA domain
LGLGSADAATQIGNAGLVPVQREQTVTDPADDGVVVDQRPGAGATLDEGAEVVIIIGVLEETDTLEDTEPEEP